MNWVLNVCLAHHETFIRLDRSSCLVVVSPCDLAFSVFLFVWGFFWGCLFWGFFAFPDLITTCAQTRAT